MAMTATQPQDRAPQAAHLAVRTIEAMPWLDDVAERMETTLAPLVGPQAPQAWRDLLNGTWLGHPLHPAVVTMPIGCWVATSVFDALGERRAADLSLTLGVASATVAAATGAAQWIDVTKHEQPRRMGALHASLNTVALGMYVTSGLLRKRNRRAAGVLTAAAGLGVTMASAYFGGSLAYDLGIGVNRTAYEPRAEEWTDAIALDDLPDGTHQRVIVAGAPVLLVHRNGELGAIGATCTHLGGPLDEGEISGDGLGTVTCPWHGSTFCLDDGSVLTSPATSPAVTYQVRVRESRVEIRAATTGHTRSTGYDG